MKWDSKHVRQKHFRFYVPPICRVLPKHNAQRPSKEGRDWTFIWIEQKALPGLQNCLHIYIHKRHDRSFRELFSVYQQMSCKHLHQFRLYIWFMSLKYNRYRLCKKNTFLSVKLFFLDFPYCGRPWRKSFLLHNSKSQNRATYFLLNKTWSLSPNLKPNGILMNEKDKNLPLSL